MTSSVVSTFWQTLQIERCKALIYDDRQEGKRDLEYKIKNL